jgi:hypothetical protein
VRSALVVVTVAIVVVVLFVVTAGVLIPLAAPPPGLPTMTIPAEALRECPAGIPGCR